MAQWVTMLAAKLDNLGSTPRTHMVDRELIPEMTSTRVPRCVCIVTHTKQTNK